MADTQNHKSVTINGADQWTSPISPTYRNKNGYGEVRISISDNGDGNKITLQCKLPTDADWGRHVDSWQGNIETSFVDKLEGVLYRLGCESSGDYVGGNPVCELSK